MAQLDEQHKVALALKRQLLALSPVKRCRFCGKPSPFSGTAWSLAWVSGKYVCFKCLFDPYKPHDDDKRS